MENTHQKNDVNNVINQMKMVKFQGVFKAAWDLLKKEPVILLGLFLVPMIINAVINTYGPLIDVGSPIANLIVKLLLTVLTALIGLFGAGLLFHAAAAVYDGKKVNINATFKYVQTNFAEAIRLVIKLFVYTGSWILIAYMLVAGLMVVAAPGLAITLWLLFPVILIVYIIVFFKKIVNSSMSYAAFWSAEKPNAEAALSRSLELCENLTWTIFGNYLLMGLVGALFMGIVGGILAGLFAAGGVFGAAILAAILGTVMGTFYALFQYCLKAQVEKFRGPDASHHHSAPTHHQHA